MSEPVHPLWRAAHAAALVLGAALAVWGLVDSARLAGVEPDHVSIRRAWTCAALLAVVVAFAVTASPRWATWRALPSFSVSYLLVGLTLEFQLSSVLKDFAPEVPTWSDYAIARAKMVGALGIAALLALDAIRAGRRKARSHSPQG